MSERTQTTPSLARLILIPSVITLAITVLRLVGELQHWSDIWFNPSPGGGGALVGIVWLGPIFGIYFALKLSAAGQGPPTAERSIGIPLLGVIILVLGFVIVAVVYKAPGSRGSILIVSFAGALAGLVQFYGWPALCRALIAYAYAARVPVAIVMFFAIKGSWGTHYDGPPPNFPEMGWFPRFLWIGLLPQLVGWVGFTIVTGALFGSIATAVAHRRKPALRPVS